MGWNMSESRGRFLMIGESLLLKGWILVALVVVSGCATYRPMPITPETAHAGLISPDMQEVRLRANGFKHPLLKPVPFDDRDGLSPEEAAILAVIANPTLRAVRDRRGIASAQLLQAGILPNPQLSYDLGIPVGGDTQGRVNSFGLGLGWDITSLISRSARLDAAKAHAAAVDLGIAWQEWQVAEAARLHAYRLVIAGQRLVAAKQAEDFFQRLLKDVKQSVALGVKTQLDLSAVETSLQEASSRVLNAQSTVEQERLAFNRALGLPSQRMVPLEKDIAWQLEQCPPAKTLFEDAETKRLDLLALKLGYESQEARVRAAVRSQFPKINLGLTGGRDTDGIQTIGVGVSIDLPFFDRNQGRIAKERASRQQLFDEYTARLFETRADIDRLVAAIKATRQQLAAIDKSLSTGKALFENLSRAADAGQVDIFSYYKAVSAFYDKQVQRIELEQRMIELGIALEIASGRYGLVSKAGHTIQKPGQTTRMEMPK
ncbi:TolC family protein [Dissulfurirhabdus thermomarina]|uniref:TolC family protein n=1 Tax=Dissulfurirhabdus thermomarina TaxID=1765737 RepID=A0A6N9TMA0_DISTH|nr:TolC family protein [Dissulfurirhabdus thermomarina]NDY41560.1 TolC family protein [Dissulfurirhabdus thermomarina]NMX24525.1 TolC family protein [Dissulfurirhabdus thermomarina]